MGQYVSPLVRWERDVALTPSGSRDITASRRGYTLSFPGPSLAVGELHEGEPQLTQFGRFVEHPIHVQRNVVFGGQPLSPTGQHDHGGRGCGGFDGRRDAPPVDVRHTQVRDHGGKELTSL